MAGYDAVGKFYDDIMGEQKESAEIVFKQIKKYHPGAKSVLELGCGTCSYLKYLSKHYHTSGLDLSPVLLSAAREKLPKADLYEASMLDFELHQRFDVVITLNDTINHFTKISEIRQIVDNTLNHLAEGGLFIFDINTAHKLETLSHQGPIVHQFEDNYLITNVSKVRKDIYEWDLRIFECIGNNDYKLHEELIYERAYSVVMLNEFLRKHFKMVKMADFQIGKVTAKSERLYFICNKH